MRVHDPETLVRLRLLRLLELEHGGPKEGAAVSDPSGFRRTCVLRLSCCRAIRCNDKGEPQ